jgi:hypothetical protein
MNSLCKWRGYSEIHPHRTENTSIEVKKPGYHGIGCQKSSNLAKHFVRVLYAKP